MDLHHTHKKTSITSHLGTVHKIFQPYLELFEPLTINIKNLDSGTN